VTSTVTSWGTRNEQLRGASLWLLSAELAWLLLAWVGINRWCVRSTLRGSLQYADTSVSVQARTILSSTAKVITNVRHQKTFKLSSDGGDFGGKTRKRDYSGDLLEFVPQNFRTLNRPNDLIIYHCKKQITPFGTTEHRYNFENL
jgi:hypothetical protein